MRSLVTHTPSAGGAERAKRPRGSPVLFPECASRWQRLWAARAGRGGAAPKAWSLLRCAHTSRYTVPAAVFCHGPTWYAESSAGRNSTYSVSPVHTRPVPRSAAQRSAAASQTVLKMSSRCSQPLTPEIYSAALEPSRVPFHRPAPWPASAALEPQARALACLGRACALARAEPAEHRSPGVAVWYKRGTAGTRGVVRIAAPLWAKGRPGALVGPSRARPSTSARIGRGCGDALLWVEPLRRG